MMEEMCPLFEEFCAIIGCDPNAPLVRHEVKIGYVRSFENLFQFSRPQARAMIVGDQKAILLPLIDEFSEVCSDNPDRMRLRMRALVFCLLAGFLFNKDPGFGDLRLCPMVRQMEDMGCIGGIVLAKTIRSLDRAALGFEDWTVSPIILQMGIDQTVPIMDDSLSDSAITLGVIRAVLRAWVRDHQMVRPLPNPSDIQTSPEYRA
ncbi:hypothetical protein JCGZ_25151 [Jatropha curcas]|uniref:Uncharacterized protein n=1 Tax=Jatropha curcas TaxID=180498 RepID=A0A067JLV4_JATCU|nr:hypothetical protein JCGZ_25151 [Jatropha curcas]